MEPVITKLDDAFFIYNKAEAVTVIMYVHVSDCINS